MATPDSFSAGVASDVLQSGGNAVDAAVAVAFSLAVTYPEAGNIGGGGFMLAWVNGEAAFMDYRETAPAAGSRDMYLDARGEVIEDSSLTGHRAVGVPGTAAGLWVAHRRYGRLEWKDLLQPAIDLAEHGFLVPGQLEERVREESPRIGHMAGFSKYFGGLRGDAVFRQPDLAAVYAGSAPAHTARTPTCRILKAPAHAAHAAGGAVFFSPAHAALLAEGGVVPTPAHAAREAVSEVCVTTAHAAIQAPGGVTDAPAYAAQIAAGGVTGAPAHAGKLVIDDIPNSYN